MSFTDIIGHERIVEVLRRSVRTGKTAHAYIFEGIPGCGRKKTAMALIQAIFCDVAGDDACGICPSCRKVSAGNHGDIHIMEPLPDKRDISIDQLRELQRELSLRPYEAPRKACIMEPADKMNTNSANSFLKTLEEPPGNALIILLTENADMLLPTIRSRCQLLRFSPLSTEHVGHLLKQHGINDEASALTAQMADGSMQRALELDNSTLSQRRELLIKHVTGLDPERIATVFEASEEFCGNREETLENLDILLSFARDMLHLTVGCNEIVNKALQPILENLVAGSTIQQALQRADDILETRRSVQRNANVKLAMDRLLMKMIRTAA